MTTSSDEGSITRCLGLIRAGDRAAAQPLWERYFGRLVALARGRLRAVPRSVDGAEDVALSAFDSFYRRAERGQFPQLQDRDDLWQVLYVLTVRKAINLLRHQGRKSRGGGRVRTLSDLDDLGAVGFLDPEPTPQLAAILAEECRHRLDALSDPTLRQVALWRLEGCTNAEIAARLGCVEHTVERKLRRIREIWDAGGTP
jgi:DNA-directed RNA polymerase specialized sigma24 family protein